MPYLWFSGLPAPEKNDTETLLAWSAEYSKQGEEAENDLLVLILMACASLEKRDPSCCGVCETARVRGHSAVVDLLPTLSGRRRALVEGALKALDGTFSEEERTAFLDLQEELMGEALIP